MRLTPDHLLHGYANGIFPMAEGRNATEIYWVDPEARGILPLDQFHISRSLARRIRAEPFRITFNAAFSSCVAGCAERPETWINAQITTLYDQLHHRGFAHSLEVWEDKTLVGGVYGVAIGAAFFGESMFSRRTDASKIALAYLTHRLRAGGFTLFDTQFITDHLKSLGAVEIPRADYHKQMHAALQSPADIYALKGQPSSDAVLKHRKTQTS